MAKTLASTDGSDARPICKVAIVGAGRMAREHIRAFIDVPNTNVVGIHSRTRARAEALASEFHVPAVYSSIRELYEKTLADLVVVAVPELQANEVCQACFEHPWTALIEKPAGYNVADAESIAAAARKKARRAYVALNRRHFGSTRAILGDLATQPGPRLIKVQDQENPAAAEQAGYPKTLVENWMYANSIHLIDFFSTFGRGRVTDVLPVIRHNVAHPLFVAARIVFDSGDVGLYDAVWNAPAPWVVSVATPAKRWEMRPIEKATSQVLGSRTLDSAPDEPWDTQFKPGFRRQAELAVRAAAGEQTELPTLDDALVSMRLTQAIYAQA